MGSQFDKRSLCIFRTYNEYKKAQPILDIADTFLKMPLSSMEHTLKNAITHAGDGVAQTFFDKRDSKFMIAGKDFTSLRNDMAICIMVKGLGQVRSSNGHLIEEKNSF